MEDKLARQIEAARRRMESLYQRVETSPTDRALLQETLQELSNSLEELRVTTEELHSQNNQLTAMRGLAEEQRRHYRDLFELAPDGYLVTDTAGIVQEANQKAAEMLGVRQDFLMGKPMIVFIPEREHNAFRDLLKRFKEHAHVQTWETEMQPRGRAHFSAAVTVSVIRQSPSSGWQPIGLRWLVRDMTDRKRVEAQIQNNLRRLAAARDINLAITSTLDLQWILDRLLEKLEDSFSYTIATTVRLFDHKTGLLEPLWCRNLDAAEWRAGGVRSPRARLKEIIRTRAPLVVLNVQTDAWTQRPDFYRRNGLVSYLGMPLLIADEIMGFLCVYTKEERAFSPEEVEFLNSIAAQAAIAIQNSRLYEQVKTQAAELQRAHDELEERVRERTAQLAQANETLTAEVAERKRVEEKLRKSEGRLSELTKELERQLIASDRLVSIGELSASVAHEFNNPLQIILGFAQEALHETKPSDPQHEALEIIEKETQRCKELIRNLMDFARPAHAALEVAPVEPIIRNSVQLAWHHLLSSKVKIETDIGPDLPPIHADPHQLQQVLMNLLFNAAEAMPDGGTVKIRAAAADAEAREARAAPGRELTLSVSDSGVGIAAENRVNIFRPFFTTKKKKGMGLGLSICERIVEAHGGRITVDSEPGKGATFHLHFPLTEARRYGRAS